MLLLHSFSVMLCIDKFDFLDCENVVEYLHIICYTESSMQYSTIIFPYFLL